MRWGRRHEVGEYVGCPQLLVQEDVSIGGTVGSFCDYNSHPQVVRDGPGINRLVIFECRFSPRESSVLYRCFCGAQGDLGRGYL